jgi:hypothetical protein
VGQRARDLAFCGGGRIAARNLAACIVFALLGASNLHAATITVVNSLDSGIGSLRDAVALANPGDTIDFAPALAGGTVVLTSGEILIDKNLTITGLGASALAVSGNNVSRVFNVTGGTVFISGLTISSGLSGNGGGGIYNAGTLFLTSSTVSENSAFQAIPGSLCGGVGTNGGGIYNAGTLTLTDSTVSGNSSFGNCGGGLGGGIYNHPQGTLTVSKSTLSENGSALGGGIYNDGTVNNGGTVVLSNSTVSANGVAGSAPAVAFSILARAPTNSYSPTRRSPTTVPWVVEAELLASGHLPSPSLETTISSLVILGVQILMVHLAEFAILSALRPTCSSARSLTMAVRR